MVPWHHGTMVPPPPYGEAKSSLFPGEFSENGPRFFGHAKSCFLGATPYFPPQGGQAHGKKGFEATPTK